ncbi:MAG: type II secretion system protein GspM [Azoarcus sp.]|nr:type II secretion system protein GspM [Azoarcus sp.]
MNFPPAIHPGALRSELVRRWHALGQRERRSVQLAAGVVSIVLLGGFVHDLLAERQQLASRLPTAQTELVRMRAAATEIADLRKRTPITAAPSIGAQPALALDIARLGAEQHGMALALSLEGDESILFSGHAETTVVLEWLAALHVGHGLSVRTLSIRTRPGPDEVSGALIVRTSP